MKLGNTAAIDPKSKMDLIHPNKRRAVNRWRHGRPGVLKWALALMLLGACGRFEPTATTLIPSIIPLDESPTATTSPPRSEESPIATTSMVAIPTTTLERRGADKLTLPGAHVLSITIIYDNHPFDPRLRTAWGFSALIQYQGATLLFDTGADTPTLLGNMRLLGIDPARIDFVVLSHAHADHIGGLSGLLAQDIHPAVFMIPSMSDGFKRSISQMTTVIEVTPGLDLSEGVFTTGEMDHGIPEQALAIRTSNGLVIITGCAHPGVAQMAAQAKTLHDDPIHLVLGGYHLRGKAEAELKSIIAAFRQLGVEKVAPCHCTGDQAIALFREEYGEDFIQAGAGRVIIVQP
jgi:7,8-dihydropterin-6-yl-methyl-4-(beta-D-ribofuranosyl)aminobenzene 5'-phosphate synthase